MWSCELDALSLYAVLCENASRIADLFAENEGRVVRGSASLDFVQNAVSSKALCCCNSAVNE